MRNTTFDFLLPCIPVDLILIKGDTAFDEVLPSLLPANFIKAVSIKQDKPQHRLIINVVYFFGDMA
jgi:hypothetical protein